MTSIRRRGRAGLFALSVIASAASTSAAPLAGDQPSIASIPLFARFETDGTSLRGYKAPVHLDGSLHKFFISLKFEREGEVSFAQPDSLDFTLNSVPQQYSSMLSQLGTPRTWPYDYTFVCVKTVDTDGTAVYELHGVPKSTTSDVDHLVVRMQDGDAPIQAVWVLKDGWTVTSTIDLEAVGNYLMPKEENAHVTGHGFDIHSDVTYGNYVVSS
jgi:hypothetical protein